MWKIKLLAIVVSVSLLFGGGYLYSKQMNELKDLREQIVHIQEMNKHEQAHLDRDAERQKAIEELEQKKGRIINESVKDTSDSGSVFSSSRVRRLNEIR